MGRIGGPVDVRQPGSSSMESDNIFERGRHCRRVEVIRQVSAEQRQNEHVRRPVSNEDWVVLAGTRITSRCSTYRNRHHWRTCNREWTPHLARGAPMLGGRHSGFYPFGAHCCHVGTAIKHPVPDRVKPSFVIFDIRALWRSRSGLISKITNGGLTRSGTGCFIAVPIWQQWESKSKGNAFLRYSWLAFLHLSVYRHACGQRRMLLYSLFDYAFSRFCTAGATRWTDRSNLIY